MTRSTSARWVLWSVLLLLPAGVSAQPVWPAPRVAIAAGTGVALPFHGDLDFTPWTWESDLRLRMSRPVWFEVAAGEWRSTEVNVTTNLPSAMPPHVIERAEHRTSRATRMVQGNLLFGGRVGRVGATVGGGVGLLQHARRVRTTLDGCPSGVTCGTFETNRSQVSGTIQAVGGADVLIVRGAAVYAQGRLIVPMRDPGSSELRLTGGLRWFF